MSASTEKPGFVSRSITAENQFTDWLRLEPGRSASVSIFSTAISATVTLQRKFHLEADAAARDVEQWTADTEQSYVADEATFIRIGVKTGDFTSATALVVRLGYGGRRILET